MINVCFQCGEYRADKLIDPSGPYAICPECGYKHLFVMSPLLIITGASATGKTTVCQSLLGHLSRTVLLDSDIIWRSEFDTPNTKYRDFFETWLRICKNISQSGQLVTLFGAGVGVPENIELCVERRYFSLVRYLALVCSDSILKDRLLSRPAWRASHDPAFITQQLIFNRWFKDYTEQPPITVLDNSEMSVEETSQQVAAWIDREIEFISL
jgi:adenylate kinase family enzyme/DNA-directed RNA polymerase subunit RPC12/RpoP